MSRIRKVYIFCDAGITTSIMVNRMMDVAREHGLPFEFSAHAVSMAHEAVDSEKPIAILVSPQVRFLQDKIKAKYEPKGIAVGAIDSKVFASLDAKKAIQDLITLLKN